MLRLNPNDNQGIRYELMSLLIKMKRDSLASELQAQYEDDASAFWAYSRALLAFRRSDDSPAARLALKKAINFNKFVPDYLTGRKPMPLQLPDYVGFGDENEAIDYVSSNFQNWWGTRGAIEWLKGQQASEPMKHKPPKKNTSRGKRGTKRS
jgi:hypothetical protein